MNLFTGKELVAELARLGLGTWTSDAVRQWIREEVPCPIAQASDQGKPHRYNLLDVLSWMQDRAKRERAKGFTSAAQVQLLDRIEIVIRQFVTGHAPVAAATATATVMMGPGFDFVPPAAPLPAELLSPAKPPAVVPVDIESSTDVNLLMSVIRGTLSPDTWNSVETALGKHRTRLEKDGLLIPAEDLDLTLETQAVAVRSALLSLIVPLSQRIPDISTFDQRRLLLQAAFEELLRRMAGETYQESFADDEGQG